MSEKITIALAGNPNSGKTTLFNRLTGSNQFVGNWPGVTVEKKEGKLKQEKNVAIIDLPGIYSLSPYTLEEVIVRDYLIETPPDTILNIVDGTNLERNLYLTTQLIDLGIPLVVAINMADIVEKNGDIINIKELSQKLNCAVVEISALKGDGVTEVVKAAVDAIQSKEQKVKPSFTFSDKVECALKNIQESIEHYPIPPKRKRWCALKIFERDQKITASLGIDAAILESIENIISATEEELDDNSESIIANERYGQVSSLVENCFIKKHRSSLSTSDKIDRVVTNRWLGLPIFAIVMFLVYYLAMVGIGAAATDWANDGVFGEGYHLFGIGASAYDEAQSEYSEASCIVEGYDAFINERGEMPLGSFSYVIENEDTLELEHGTANVADYYAALETIERYQGEPNPADYGIWVPGVPVLMDSFLGAFNTAPWLRGLINDGIIAGVGAVLGFVPQMLILFLLLAFLESCGYMSRVAFILDRIFRKFGLSGKSFISMLVGAGCGVPGVMASRTIENERDRRMTIMTTTFIPCGAKIPFIAMIAGAIFNGSAWVATSAYFIGMASIVISGIILKKTSLFAGDPAPFVMELPAYHLPTVSTVFLSMWERGWSFIKKAGTLILLSTIIIWFLSNFGFINGALCMLEESDVDRSILAGLGNVIAWIFQPLGWGTWEATVASITGLVAKENIVGTMGVLYGASGDVYAALGTVFTGVTGYSFLVFNLLCAPCFAAIGAIKREMNNAKWTLFAIGYQCAFAYIVALMINQFGSLFTGNMQVGGVICATVLLIGMVYLLVRQPYAFQDKRGLKTYSS